MTSLRKKNYIQVREWEQKRAEGDWKNDVTSGNSGKGSGFGKKMVGLDLDMLTSPSENGSKDLRSWD